MIQMSELVRDANYKAFLDRVPDLPPIMADKAKMVSPPWVVYVQREAGGKWGSKQFWKYNKALKFFYRALELGVHDAALNCKRKGFPPPSRMVRIKGKYMKVRGKMVQATKRTWWKMPVELRIDQPEHLWCMYCRRPTVFKYFSRHKRLGSVDASVKRCTICGASERIAVHAESERYRR